MRAGRVGLFLFAITGSTWAAWAQVGGVSAVNSSAEAQSLSAPQEVPTIHVTSRIVVLDVVVSDGHSHPVKGLTAADFSIQEDGVPQKVLSISEHEAAPPAPLLANTPLPPNTFTVQPAVRGNGAVTVIVLSGFSPFLRDQLRDYFKSSTPAAPTAIFRIDWQGMHLVQGFTAKREVLLEAAMSKRIWPPLGLPVRFARARGTPAQHLAQYLAKIPGRINVIWIGGAPVGEMEEEFPDLSDFVQDLGGMTDVRRLSRVALYTIGTSGPPMPSIDRVSFGSLTGTFDPALAQLDVATEPDTYAMFANQDTDDLVARVGGRSFRYVDPKNAIAQVEATGSHYYTVSYRPSNEDWNGAYRRIHVDVDGYDQPPVTLRWSQLLTGWAEGAEPRLIYRRGYVASDRPPVRGQDAGFRQGTAAVVAANGDAVPAARRVLSVSPKGRPARDATGMQAAMGFATPTPSQIHFSVVVTPAMQKEKTKPGEDLPAGNYLTGPFRDGAYRYYKVHYWVDPQDLRLLRTASGSYRDDLQFVAVVYRDDGVPANSVAYTAHIEVSEDSMQGLQMAGVTSDQTIAIPVDDSNYFLRVGVNDMATGHIGAVELPVEWVKAGVGQTNVAKQGR
jgi:VWFA-related protein